jgi:hypothetical protein
MHPVFDNKILYSVFLPGLVWIQIKQALKPVEKKVFIDHPSLRKYLKNILKKYLK